MIVARDYRAREDAELLAAGPHCPRTYGPPAFYYAAGHDNWATRRFVRSTTAGPHGLLRGAVPGRGGSFVMMAKGKTALRAVARRQEPRGLLPRLAPAAPPPGSPRTCIPSRRAGIPGTRDGGGCGRSRSGLPPHSHRGRKRARLAPRAAGPLCQSAATPNGWYGPRMPPMTGRVIAGVTTLQQHIAPRAMGVCGAS